MPPRKKRKAAGAAATAAPAPAGEGLAKFAGSLEKMRGWLAQYDIDSLLAAGDGIVTISNFLPEPVARSAQAAMQRLEDAGGWETDEDPDGEHRFGFADTGSAEDLADLARPFWVARPTCLPSFSAMRLGKGDHIGCRDDMAEMTAEGGGDSGSDGSSEEAEGIGLAREVGVMYWLSDWDPAAGGQWVDIEGGTFPLAPCITPQFNSAPANRFNRHFSLPAASAIAACLFAHSLRH